MPMAHNRNINHSLLYVWVAMIILCCLSVFGDRIIQPVINNVSGNIALEEFETAFQDVQPPLGLNTFLCVP